MKKLWIKISLLVMFIFAIYPYGKLQVFSYNIDGVNYCFPTWDGDWILDSELDGLTCEFPRLPWRCIIDPFTLKCNRTFDVNNQLFIRIFGDIYVGSGLDFTITIPNGVTMGIDLRSNFIDFTDNNGNIRGKIQLQGTAKIDNSVLNRYYVPVEYDGNGITKCPKGTVVLDLPESFVEQNEINNSKPILNGEPRPMDQQSGNLYCVKIGPNARYTCKWKQWDDNTNQYVNCNNPNGRDNNECAKICWQN